MTTMSESRMRLHFLSLVLLCCVSPSSSFTFKYDYSSFVACGPHQSQALTEFMNEFDSSHCNLSDPFNGVWCDNSTGAVTKLRLSDCLSGTLKPNSSLFRLHHLRFLVLIDNNFISSSLPSEFGSLNSHVPSSFNNLSFLLLFDLSHNELTGSFPLVRNLTKLSLLKISNNHLSGALNPSCSLFELPHLRYLDLEYNNFSSSFSSEFGNLNRLEVLSLSSNDFFGQVPPTSVIPTNLEILLLPGCGIIELPNILKKLEKLEFIDFSDNRIKGKIPEWLWNLPRLTSVFVPNNSITGFKGPMDVLVNSSLKNLDIEKNCFEGAIPILPLSINFFEASYNRFTGSIPLSICNYRSLTLLKLSNNNLTGPIPQCLSNLTAVSLRKNNLEGNIPEAFYTGASLQTLDVGHNLLTGKLPRSLLNCSSLELLVVDHNRIKDTFPFWLKALPNLQVLILSSNKFYGSISPPGRGPLGFPELRIFEISDNKFTGSLPTSYFVNWKATSLTMNEDGGLYMEYIKFTSSRLYYNSLEVIDLQYKGLRMEQERVLTSYAAIDISGNRIEGQIPESIGLLKALIAFNFSNNFFTGHIPLSLANLKKLESLDLSRNQLSGTIPSGLGTLSFLAYINVSHNHLKGEIPQGTQITGQPKSSFEGNAGLCGLPLQETCFGTIAPPTRQPSEEDEEVLNWKGVAIGYGVGVLFGLAIMQVIASYKPEWLVKIIGYGPGVLLGLAIAQVIASYKPEWLGTLGFPKLLILEISDNEYDGSLPSTYFINWKASSLTMNDDGGIFMEAHMCLYFLRRQNKLEGQIPETIEGVVVTLNLSNNIFTGHIPLSFAKLESLELANDNSYVACPPHQTQALTEFMNEFDSSHCNLSDPFNGVWCDNSTGAITMLQLSACLSGTLKPNSSLFRLHHLRHLDLNQNNFISSSLPSEFGNLNRLEVLTLSNNRFVGQVPSSFNNLSLLSILNLSQNTLTGSFPPIRNLVKLSVLDLSNNHFSGTLNSNSSLFKLHHLRHLDLGSNNLSSSIPYEFGNLNKLEVLSLLFNDFFGKVPPTISNLTSLKELYLHHNQLTGSFPLVQNLTMLSVIDINHNLFSGTIPSSLFTMPSLSRLDMRVNNLTAGSIEVYNSSTPSRLEYLYLGHNNFKGKVIGPISTFNNLKILVMGKNCFEGAIPILPVSINIFDASGNRFTGSIPLSNNLTGPIPQCLSNLTAVSLRKNNLEGNIPEAFYTGASLQTLDVGHNLLTGKLPRSLLNCSSLELLVVDHNMIEDTFPFWLKALPNLQLRIFEISDNKFTGSLPPMYFVNWKAASLTMNEDGGLYMVQEEFDHGMLHTTTIETIDLRYKGLSMEQERILNSYATIDFSGNRIEGQIPESIDLSSNQLSWTIPSGLGTLSFLAYINVSHNQLKGEIPQGTQIMGQPKSSFEGNAGLCGLPLQETFLEY
ncbi:hypothetical protein HID58_062769 [Brassica napus]|uniref:Disease resistance R13L4/SHOC-2-like LRR domain-containing protein n=1 Tax=Brassica napus TaxID=3708 RepID=A0ABQ8A368_BRANA|nr:hypothetical protein HID58_062769 [Brassica napus]